MSSLSSFSQQTDKTFWKYGHLIFTGFYLLPLITSTNSAICGKRKWRSHQPFSFAVEVEKAYEVGRQRVKQRAILISGVIVIVFSAIAGMLWVKLTLSLRFNKTTSS